MLRMYKIGLVFITVFIVGILGTQKCMASMWEGNAADGWRYKEENGYKTGWISENGKWYFIDSLTQKTSVGVNVIGTKEYMFNTQGELEDSYTVNVYNNRLENMCDKIMEIWKNGKPGNYYYASDIEVKDLEEARRLSEYGQYNYLLYGNMSIKMSEDNLGRKTISINMKDCKEKADKNIEAYTVLRRYIVEAMNKNLGTEASVTELARILKENIKYECNPTKNTGYSGLIEGKTACHGFSILILRGCRMMGIPCEYVLGNIPSGYHGWNRINIDGKLMYLDCSIDNPVLRESLSEGYTFIRKAGW